MVVAAAEPALTLAGNAEARRERTAASDLWARRFVYSVTAAYALLFGAAAAVCYLSFQEPRFDLGNMIQAVWSTSHGHLLRVSGVNGVEVSRLGAHVDPFLALLVPFWWAWSSPLVLLIVQAIAVSAGAIPVYWLARKHLHSSRLATAFAVVYLLRPSTQFNTFTPIGLHAVSFAIPLILFAIWFLDEERLVLFSLFAVVAATTKEEIGAAVGCLGIWYAIRKGHRLVGWTIFAVGFTITLFNMLVIIPHYAANGVSPFADRYQQVGGTPRGMVHMAVTDPIAFVNAAATWHKLLFVALLFAPLLGLWLFEPLMLIGAVPDLAINLLSSKPEQTSIFYHYTAGIVPFVIAASVLGAARMKRDPRRILHYVVAIAAGTAFISPLVFTGYTFHLVRPSNPVRMATEHALNLVPPGAPVSASQSLGAYLSTRRFIAVFPNTLGARWVVVGRTASGYDHPRAFWTALARLEASPAWKLAYQSHGVTVLQRR